MTINCPLCDTIMITNDDGDAICSGNKFHTIKKPELDKLHSGMVDNRYLRHRMQIRVAKAIGGR